MSGRQACAGALAVLLMCAHAAAQTPRWPGVTPTERATRDQARLQRARAENQQQQEAQRAQARRVAAATAVLAELQDERARLATVADDMARRAERAGQDVELVNAVARSAALELAGRLRGGPLAADDPQRLRSALALADQDMDADALYRLWFALHGELAASASHARFDAPVQLVDGIRATTGVVRFGAQLMVAGRQPVHSGGADGLVQLAAPLTFAPPGRVVPDGAWRYVAPAPAASEPGMARRQVYDGGWIARLILLCAGVGVLAGLHQAGGLLLWSRRTRAAADAHPALVRLLDSERRHLLAGDRRGGTPRTRLEDRRLLPQAERRLGVLASLAMLLGLLGTVLGMIYTFRSLSLDGGGDAGVAAAGISHALSTTWLGLCIAIPLTLLQASLRGWRGRLEHALHATILAATHGGVAPSAGSPVPRRDDVHTARLPRRSARRLPPSAAAGVVLAALLFVLMAQLLRAPGTTPPPPSAGGNVTRVLLPRAAPPPPDQPVTAAPRDAQTASATQQPLTLPALPDSTLPPSALSLPVVGVDLPAGPTGTGAGATLAGSDTSWMSSAGASGFAGDDLIPIASARPDYPQAAARARSEGWVELVFRIRASGEVYDVRVVDAEPPGVFENAAAEAMRRWLYAPLYRGGQPVEREATQLMRFRLADLNDADHDSTR